MTRANAAAIARICVHLDGIPLAIELAAARVRHFSPQTLLARLERGLAVLQAEAHDIPARQQTLRGAIAWSYDLLEPEEQRVFRRFAIFVNGATLEAAEQICAGAEKEHVAEALVALVDKSMLQRRMREGFLPFIPNPEWSLPVLSDRALRRKGLVEGEAEIIEQVPPPAAR